MEELKRRMLRIWASFYRWLSRHWFGLTLGLILGAWFF